MSAAGAFAVLEIKCQEVYDNQLFQWKVFEAIVFDSIKNDLSVC